MEKLILTFILGLAGSILVERYKPLPPKTKELLLVIVIVLLAIHGLGY
jgi:hypothetical protein